MGYIPDPKDIEVLDPAIAAILRTKTPAERVEMALEANRVTRILIAAYLRSKHPDWTEDEISAEAGLWICPEVREIRRQIAQDEEK